MITKKLNMVVFLPPFRLCLSQVLNRLVYQNTNRAEGRGANARLFYLTLLPSFIVTRVIPLHMV